MRPATKRRIHKSRLLALAAAAVACCALLSRRRGSGSSSSSSSGSGSGSGGGGGSNSTQAAASLEAAFGAGDAGCPVSYHRHTVDEIRHGAKPYLLGGIAQRPGCTNCRPGGEGAEWAGICQFKAGQLCTEDISHWITWAWIERGHELALRLTPCDLWRHVSGRTLWVLGDSMSLDLWKAAQCFLFEFWQEPRPVNATQDAEVQEQFSRLLLSTCAVLQQGTRVCYVRVDKGGEIVSRVLPLLPRVAAPTDLLVVNFGLHHGGREDYDASLAAFTEYVQAHRDALPRVLWHQTSQQHFAGGSGEYPGGQGPFECTQIANFSVVRDGVVELEPGKTDPFNLLAGNWRNAAADAAMRAAGIPTMPSYNETVWMHDMHRWNERGLECTHFCHPSAPQTWVVALYRALQGPQPAGTDSSAGAG